MKPRSLTHLLALPIASLLATQAHGLELVASSFGGCGSAGSASYATAGTSDPSGGRPTGCGANVFCPGPMVTAFLPVLAGPPQAHVVHNVPGVVTVMAIPDVPGWTWATSTNLVNWSPLPNAAENPVQVPIDTARRFFRLEQP